MSFEKRKADAFLTIKLKEEIKSYELDDGQLDDLQMQPWFGRLEDDMVVCAECRINNLNNERKHIKDTLEKLKV